MYASIKGLIAPACLTLPLVASSPHGAAVAGEAETKIIAACAQSSPDLSAFVACTGHLLTVAEAAKCFETHWVQCYGPSNTIRVLIDKNVAGPAKDLRDGDLGRSDQSLWRKAGLPHVKLW